MTELSYPTRLLKPTSQSRLVREVVWRDMALLAQNRRRVDVPMVTESVYLMYQQFKRLNYDVSELLSLYEYVDKTRKKSSIQLTVDMVPWETVPADIMERCLDENFELRVTDELRRFLGVDGNKSGEQSVFDRVEYKSRYLDGSQQNVVPVPIYDKNGKCICTRYVYYDEKTGDFKQGLVRKPGAAYVEITVQEVDYVVDMFEHEENVSGIPRRLLAQTLWSLYTCALEYRKKYYEQSYLERLITKSPEELRNERLEQEKEYALSRRGDYCEDTSVLWRYG